MTSFEKWQIRLAVGLAIIAINGALFLFSAADAVDRSVETFQRDFLALQDHAKSVASVMALDLDFLDSIEQGNYAESMQELLRYREAKIASSIAILDSGGMVFADSTQVGGFGGPFLVGENDLIRNQSTGYSVKIAERQGALSLFVFTALSSLNGQIGHLIIGQDLREHCAELSRLPDFPLTDVQIHRAGLSELPGLRSRIMGAVQITLPDNWVVDAKVVGLSRLQSRYLWQTALMTCFGLVLILIYGRFKEAEVELKKEQALRASSARLVALGEM